MTEQQYVNTSVHINNQGGRQTDGFAVTGFTLGLIGMLLSWVPIIGTVAWFLVIPGALFSAVGISREVSPGLSVSGLILSMLGFLTCMVYAVLFGAVVSAVQ